MRQSNSVRVTVEERLDEATGKVTSFASTVEEDTLGQRGTSRPIRIAALASLIDLIERDQRLDDQLAGQAQSKFFSITDEGSGRIEDLIWPDGNPDPSAGEGGLPE